MCITKELLTQLYIDQNKPRQEVATILDINEGKLKRLLKAFNIKKDKTLVSQNSKNAWENKTKEELDKINDKRINTTNKKYGCDNVFQAKIVKDKIKEKLDNKTDQEKNSIKLKRIETNIEKYGCEYVLQNKEILEKQKQTYRNTCLQNYGTVSTMQNHLDKETVNIINNKNNFISFLESIPFDKRTSTYCISLLNYSRSRFDKKIKRYGCENLINQYKSSYEHELQELYKQKGIDLYKNKTILNGLEIDLYNDKYKVGIEFNGDYYHSEIYKDKLYHQQKSLLAEQKGIKLYHIFEHDWINHKEKIIMMLDNLFGLSKPIYARNCSIKEITSEEKSLFLNNNHFQNNDTSSVNLGLYYNNQLVSVMTFCKPRFNKNYEWELSRFCNLAGYRVIGGASKLLKYFIKKYNPNNIISYSNIARTTGNLYKQLQFKLIAISEPNYIWFKNLNNIKSRYQCQMKNEAKIMTRQGYYKIYDCGNKVWVWTK